MAAKKYLNLNTTTGRTETKSATVVSAGVANDGDIVALDSTGKIDVTVLPIGVGPDVKTVETTENLVGGKYVNFFNASGTTKVRLADASNDRPAHGFVKNAYTTGQNSIVYFEGPNDDLSSLTPGKRQYLDTAGGTTETPRTTGLHQLLGVAVDDTTINTDIDDEIVLL